MRRDKKILIIGICMTAVGFSIMWIFVGLLNFGVLNSFLPNDAFVYPRTGDSNFDADVARFGVFTYLISGGSIVGQAGIAVIILGVVFFVIHKRNMRDFD